MKLSVVIAPSGAPENAFVVWRGFEDSISKAAETGYHGVELALSGAEDVDAPSLQKWLDRAGMSVSCISTGLVYAQKGLYMTHPDPGMRQETVRLFQGLIPLAAAHGGLINIGRARGWAAQGQTLDQARGLFLDCIERILPMAEREGVTLLIEPVNRYEINFINSLDDAARMLDMIGGSNMGIMADCFHMNIEDDTFEGSFTRNARYVRYVHIADSNRKAPGQGHTDFDMILRVLKQIGYNGWLSLEILPGDGPDAAARAAAKHMLPLLGRYA